MQVIRFGILALLMAVCAVSQTQSAEKKSQPPNSDRERLIGAWHLASISGPDGKPVTTGVPVGMLIYTRDGHMSVQLMYPKSAAALSNEYVEKGYEASFGSYDINETTHTVTHHVQGSNTGDLLVGKDLPRVYQFSTDGHLVIKSAVGRALVSYVGALLTASRHKNLIKEIDHDLESTSLSADA